MGRKADRIAALEQEVAALRRRASADRNAIEYAVDNLQSTDSRVVEEVLDFLGSRLRDDPRPPSTNGSLHWLHIEDGDRLVWRLAAELVALHDLEAERLGQPTWRGFGARVQPCPTEASP